MHKMQFPTYESRVQYACYSLQKAVQDLFDDECRLEITQTWSREANAVVTAMLWSKPLPIRVLVPWFTVEMPREAPLGEMCSLLKREFRSRLLSKL